MSSTDPVDPTRSCHPLRSAACIAAAAMIGALALAGCASQPSKPESEPVATPEDAARQFDALVNEYVDWYIAAFPVRATSLGIHDFDGATTDMTPSGYERRRLLLRGWLDALAKIPREKLSGTRYYDHRILEYRMRSQLLEIEQVRTWRTNPGMYNRLVASSIASLADRKFAPLEYRLQPMATRFKAVGPTFDSARKNLTDVPKLWVELALRSTKGTASYLKDSLRKALNEQGYEQLDAKLKLPVEQAWSEAIAATQRFITWMETDLAPRARGDFSLGKAVFEQKLKYDEHVDLTCEALRDRNEEAITTYKEWVAREAAKIDPKANPADVMATITKDFPPPDKLLESATELVQNAQAFVIERKIIPLPTEQLPTIRPTPAYRRLSFASMNSPGPFEEVAVEAYYNITNVDPSWDEERQKQHLTYFNRPGLLGISVHEAIPGHYTHGLYRRQSPSRLRKMFVTRSLTEGWAHYVEQMMVDEGFGDRDPKVRLGQLRRALQRHARWYAGVAMHCFGESIEKVTKRYQEIAYFAEFPALREVQRGTLDPTYLYYALGRMEILRLRDQSKARLKDNFVLGEFHRQLLAQGLPLSLFEAYLDAQN